MNKSLLSIFVACFGTVVAFGQTAPVQTPQNYNPALPGNNLQQPGAGGMIFSNRVGQAYSANDLAVQLQRLRSVVDQTLPMLTAFNESFSNSVTTGSSGVGGALSGIVSDVLHRNQPASQNAAGGQSALRATNLVAILHGLLNTNTTGAVGAAPSNAEDLKTLQTDLQPVVSVLQRLNVSPAPSVPYNGTVPMSNPYQNLSPTGR